ncbi:AbrB/MazE/SpoVT family DNA-binding domain-containing protein [Candidatus Enterococcus mansonii]|uniref:SpoVT-AbrB domain-containing protein n=1 Tax=Candidatus Enterococcus mansonii TaxID=1834181 RepID=A0A242C678_9ENTE|nr:hypothetical protein [Enterococcus sp. 4G2_DIV0659]OTO05686.1 hypothetical protein A5880_002861 [Enterococcus sp. 4G2_DIV0659]
MEELKRKIRKDGSSVVITVPVEILERLGVKVGDTIVYKEGESGIMIEGEETAFYEDGEVTPDFMSLVQHTYAEHEEAFKKLVDR